MNLTVEQQLILNFKNSRDEDGNNSDLYEAHNALIEHGNKLASLANTPQSDNVSDEFETLMHYELSTGKRSYVNMMDFAKDVDNVVNNIKEKYNIINPIISKRMHSCDKLVDACIELKDDLLMRAIEDNDGCKVVNVSTGRWEEFKRALRRLEG